MNRELLLVVEALSNEKSIPREHVFEAVEQAMAFALKRRFHSPIELRIQLDSRIGTVRAFRRWRIVDTLTNPELEIETHLAQFSSGSGSRQLNGEWVEEEILPAPEFDRITTQIAKQLIIQKLREAERQALLDQFRPRIGKLVPGSVKEVAREGFWVELSGSNGAEAFLPRSKMLPRENFRPGDRVRGILGLQPKEMARTPFQLSRSCKEMLLELLQVEIPEVGEGVIEIKGCARDPGVRAKLSVSSRDTRIDPIGACVGMRGSRIQPVSSELNGERLDIVEWDENPIQYVLNAMAPAEVSSIIMDEDDRRMDLAVPETTLAQAIGRNGQNVRLASQLTGWKLNVLGEEEFSQQSEKEAEETRAKLMDSLGLEADLADRLIEEGFSSAESILEVPQEEFESLEGFSQDELEAIREEAARVIGEKHRGVLDAFAETVRPLLPEGLPLNSAWLEGLWSLGVDSVEKLADSSVQELEGLPVLSDSERGALIMAARQHIWAKEAHPQQGSKE